MPALKHLHTYQRMKERPKMFRCVHEKCTHFQSKELLLGKLARCICGNEYHLSVQSLRLKNPHCESCTRGKSRFEPDELELVIDEILPELIQPHHLNDDQLNLPGMSEPKFEGDLGGEL